MNYNFHIWQQSKIYIGAASAVLPEVLPAGRVVVISDANVDRLHHDLLAPYETILIGTGETIKTLSTAETICRQLVALGADRSTFILGIGGGIVTDIAGFVASIYMRGVRFGFVATTLLGQVDAGVGGKNGVNLDGYKNMVGTFSQPQFVVCDPTVTATLPDREFRAGLAEAVKAGIIADPALFGCIESASYDTLRSDRALLERVIEGALGVKAAIVGRDEQETGERRKLNLGHTLGHAIEKCSNRMNHGEAVAVGLAMISRAAVRLGLLAETDCGRIVRTLEGIGFTLEPPVDVKRLLKEVAKDKKNEAGTLRVVFPTGIGTCTVREMTVAECSALFA